MARILAIDYGTKRVGIAVTDPAQIIARGLTTVPENEILKFLSEYLKKEDVSCFVVGDAKNLDNTPAEVAGAIKAFTDKLTARFKDIPIKMVDERFTSKIATRTLLDSGLKKKDRRNKALVDEISAVLILQSYLEMQAL